MRIILYIELPFLFICLFICDLFNNCVSSSDYIASNNRTINELEGMWKEAVVA
jgi:hypothetical protein